MKQQIQYKVSLTYFIQKQPQVGIDINNSTLLIGVQFGGLYVIKHHIHSVKSFHHKRIDLKKVNVYQNTVQMVIKQSCVLFF